MKSFTLSLYSEFYKSRKTLAFWGSVLLPLVIVGLITIGFYAKSENFINSEGIIIWGKYISGITGVMGVLLMPIFVVFVAYSINSIEHRSNMWKSIFTLPLNRWGIYGAKFTFGILLIALCMGLFALFLLLGGNLLAHLKPEELKFHQYNFVRESLELHTKLFLSGIGIFSVQFLLSLLWSDFLKPMGIGFLGCIVGLIAGNVNWDYAYLIPYAHPMLALQSMKPGENGSVDMNIFSQEVVSGLITAVIVFFIGYLIVSRKSVK